MSSTRFTSASSFWSSLLVVVAGYVLLDFAQFLLRILQTGLQLCHVSDCLSDKGVDSIVRRIHACLWACLERLKLGIYYCLKCLLLSGQRCCHCRVNRGVVDRCILLLGHCPLRRSLVHRLASLYATERSDRYTRDGDEVLTTKTYIKLNFVHDFFLLLLRILSRPRCSYQSKSNV